MATRTDEQRTGTFQWNRKGDNTWEPRANPHVAPTGGDGAEGTPGNPGDPGIPGPPGPSAVSAQAGNIAVISSLDSLIYVPQQYVDRIGSWCRATGTLPGSMAGGYATINIPFTAIPEASSATPFTLDGGQIVAPYTGNYMLNYYVRLSGAASDAMYPGLTGFSSNLVMTGINIYEFGASTSITRRYTAGDKLPFATGSSGVAIPTAVASAWVTYVGL